MNLIREREWYALYTRSRSEKKAARNLSDKGIEVYCPIQRVRRRWHDRFKVIEEPVFHSYVFVRIRPDERVAVLSDSLILQFVQQGGKPARIRNEEMEAVKRFLKDYEGYGFRMTEVAVNDAVRIEEGPFADYRGVVIKKKKKTASIRLEMFNAYLVAEFPDNQYSKLEIN